MTKNSTRIDNVIAVRDEVIAANNVEKTTKTIAQKKTTKKKGKDSGR